MRRTISSALVAALCGCSLGFAGGGLPATIRTVAIAPCDNVTSEPSLAQLVGESIRQAMQSRLGLRGATEQNADAVVRCKVTRYDPDQPLAIQSSQATAGVANRVDVTRRQVELSVDITVIDQHTSKTLWDGRSQVVTGDYPAGGSETQGQQKALAQLVNKVITGVQQNW